MFLPIGDSPNPPGTPWVNYTLIGVNVAVFLLLMPKAGQAPDPRDPVLVEYVRTIGEERGLSLGELRQMARQVSEYDLLVFRHGFKPSRPALVDIFAAMFLHGGLLHLLGNMLFLWIYGDNVEHRLGKLGFLAVYLGTGLAAAAGDGLIRMNSGIPSVGASGAISGVLGLYFLWFPRNRVRVWVFLFPFFANVVEMPARLVLGIYLVFDNLIPLFLTAGTGGISYGAHIGGFGAGWAVAFLLDRLALVRPEKDLRGRPSVTTTETGLQRAFREALRDGRWVEAAEWFFGSAHALTRRGLGPEDKVHLGEILERNGHPRAALAAYQRVLADHQRGPGRVDAHLGAARVLMGPLGIPTASYQHLYGALEENPTEEEAARARAMLEELSRRVRVLPRKLPH